MLITQIPCKPQLKRKIRVAAYTRVSTEKDTMIHSLSAQINYYSSAIQANNEWLYCGVYSDEGFTGTKENRPGFQEMMMKCRNGEIDMVITKSISRLARNTLTLISTVRELKELGVDVFFEKENIHTISSDGELMLTILASYAQEESRSASDNMKWRIADKFKNGIPWNGTVTGYKISNGKYEVIPEEAKTVRLIYDLYLQGFGYEAISKKLNESGKKTRNSNRWNHSSVEWILHNPVYTGNLLLQSTFTENHITKKHKKNNGEYPKYAVSQSHEAIIPAELFDLVQAEARLRAEKFHHIENQNLSPFTGKVVCGNCGCHCRRKKRHNNYVWICSTYNNRGKQYCPSKAVPESVLQSITSDNISKISVFNDNMLRIILSDGSEIDYQWQDKSRKDSWTEEMKKKAGKRSEELWQKRKLQ